MLRDRQMDIQFPVTCHYGFNPPSWELPYLKIVYDAVKQTPWPGAPGPAPLALPTSPLPTTTPKHTLSSL